ncbi:MAG: MmgE/PrpD family protein, partial [Myxococcota bacterium]
MPTHIEKLAAFVANLRYESIPERTRRAALMQLLDMVAAVHASAHSRSVMQVLDAAAGFAATPPDRGSTVLASGGRCGPAEAAMLNAICSMAFDYDDIVWMGHTCHSAVFASLAVAEHERVAWRELVTAIVAANEVGGRLGASCFFGPLNGQMWTFIHLAGAAAAASKLLGLDAEKTAH